MVFLLAFFLDFFELAFIIVPLLAPVADKLGINLIWFGVLLGVNMQTSFMHPPFGFALFYLRSVAPIRDYPDKVTGKLIAKVTTGQIYWGAVPFVVIQILMVGVVIAFPQVVSVGLTGQRLKNPAAIEIQIPAPEEQPVSNEEKQTGAEKSDAGKSTGQSEEEKSAADIQKAFGQSK
jgi:hypothetical protein